MSTQNYQNHRRYYIPHHFVFLPAMAFGITYGIIKAKENSEDQLVWLLFSLLSFAILYLGIMLRQHYALGNQNRIVRLEFRLRYWQQFNQSSDAAEKKLSFGQIAALRFASDDEFKNLIERAINEKLSLSDIKKSISNWQADNMRV